MKKIISIFLCLTMCLLFASCSVSQNQEQGKVKDNYDYSEDYMSMYRANSYNHDVISTVKSKNGKYYFSLGDVRNEIYELSALDFNKSCENRDLLKYNPDTYNYDYKYGNNFISFDFFEDGEIRLLQTYKNYLYVLINSSLYKINCDNAEEYSKIYPVNAEDDISTFFFYKDEMYIVSGIEEHCVITKADLNGNVLGEVIHGGDGFPSARDDELYNIYASNDYLYFIMRQDGRESNIFLYCRSKLDGSDKQVWKIEDSEFKFAANEKNIATVSRHYDYETGSCSGLDIEIYDSKELSNTKAFSVSANDDINEFLEDEVLFYSPIFYNGESIEIDMIFETADMREFHSQSFIINTNTELARNSSLKGLLTRPSCNEIFTEQWKMTGEESANLYFYKVADTLNE